MCEAILHLEFARGLVRTSWNAWEILNEQFPVEHVI